MKNNYRLRYLPTFENDLTAVRDYIIDVLKNPSAARLLVEETERAILKRLEAPLSFEPYHSAKERTHQYYRIRIKSYTVFYVVIDDVMEVRRFIYSKRNLKEMV